MSARKPPKPQTLVDSLRKEYRPMAKAALDAGWTVSASRGGHVKLTAPDGTHVPLPGTSRSAGLHRRISTQLRKMGLSW